MLNFLSNIFNSSKNAIEQSKQITDSNLQSGVDTSSTSNHYLYVQKYNELNKKFNRQIALTEDIMMSLDLLIANDPIISICYERIVSMADTDIELKIETSEDIYNEDIKQLIKDELPRLFDYDYNIKQASKFIIEQIVRAGFMCQIVPNKDFTDIQQLIFPQPETIKWYRYEQEKKLATWELIQRDRGTMTFINRDLFVYAPLLEIRNNDGRWILPLFKPAIIPAKIYEYFSNSLKDIAIRTGNQKVLDVVAKISEEKYKPLGNPGSNEFKEGMEKVKALIGSAKNEFNEGLPNGIVFHTDLFEIKELATIEPPQHLAIFHDLLAGQIVSGCKLYPSIVGIISRENQTTLSTNQKQALKSLITTIQSKADSALIKIIKKFLIFRGIQFKEVEIERQEPRMESSIDDLTAEKLKFEVETMKENKENGEENNIIEENNQQKQLKENK